MALLGACVFTSCARDDASTQLSSNNQAFDSSAQGDEAAALLQANGETVVYERIVKTNAAANNLDGQVIEATEVGSLTNAVFQRYARPFAFTHESVRYHFASWDVPTDEGVREKGVRVTTTDPGPAVVSTPFQPTTIDEGLTAEIASGAQTVSVFVRVRDFPDWDVPLVPPADAVSLADFADAIDAKEAALVDRKALFDTYASDVVATIADSGGVVKRRFWSIGWLVADLPAAEVASLAQHAQVHSVTTTRAIGSISTGREHIRPATHMGEQPFWDNSQYGDQPNPTRHSAAGITVAVIEYGPVKDEARAFCQNSSCLTTKFESRWRCDGTGFYCSPTTNYPTALENTATNATDHATSVASAVTADFLDGQDVSQSPAENLLATSGAREARLITFGALRGWGAGDGFPYGGDENDIGPVFTETFDWARYLESDIITGGTGLLANDLPDPLADYDCATNAPPGRVQAVTPYEQAAEAAFDGGSFVVIAPGNHCGGDNGAPFAVESPAGIPKAFVVTGLDMLPIGCHATYGNCLLDDLSSVRGPAPATIGTTTWPTALSIVDLAVPQAITHFSRCTVNPGDPTCDPDGEVINDTVGDAGTSFAAPRLAGLAALAKDWFLTMGNTWINNPGWLHTYMLGMGDGADGFGAPALNGADPQWGMGRVKMRHPSQFGLYGHDFRSFTFTSLTPVTYFVGNVPLSSSTEILKCVVAQHEDMSGKSDIGELRLDVRLKQAARSCSSSGTIVDWLPDTSRDKKKMTAMRASHGYAFANTCAEVTITPEVIPSNGSLWAQAFCYVADEEDNEPN